MKRFLKNLFGKEEEPKSSSNNQNNSKDIQTDIDYNVKFDNIISFEESLITKVTSKSESNDNSNSSALKFDPERNYDYNFFRRIIESASFQEEDIITFLKDCIDNEAADFLKYEYSNHSEGYSKKENLASFMFAYYKQEDLNDEDRPFRHLEFATKNNLGISKSLIDNYLKERDSYKRKYLGETTFPVTLFNLGIESEAINLLEYFVEEQANGLIKTIQDGDHDERTNPFALIGLLGSESASKRAIDLGFKYFKNITMGYTYSLGQFLKYIDIDRYSKCIEYWLKKYPSLDQSNSSNINGYKSLIGGEGKYVAHSMGMDYWDLFLSKKELWESYEFERRIPDVANMVMNPSLKDEDQRKIIDYMLSNLKYLNSDNDSTDSSCFREFIEVIINTKDNITEEEIEEYVPAKYNKYGNWNYIMRDINNSYKQTDIHKIKTDFVKANLISDFEIDDYTQFQDSLGQFSLYKFLDLTKKVIWFDAEAGMFPVNYKELFDGSFKSVLENCGVKDFEFIENQEIKSEGCKYTLQFRLNENIYEASFTENSDWYNVKLFSLLINKCLILSDSKLRLITIDTGDQTALLGLFEPNNFIPVLKKYQGRCWAIEGDDLIGIEYC